jgi:hypothetical protein
MIARFIPIVIVLAPDDGTPLHGWSFHGKTPSDGRGKWVGNPEGLTYITFTKFPPRRAWEETGSGCSVSARDPPTQKYNTSRFIDTPLPAGGGQWDHRRPSPQAPVSGAPRGNVRRTIWAGIVVPPESEMISISDDVLPNVLPNVLPAMMSATIPDGPGSRRNEIPYPNSRARRRPGSCYSPRLSFCNRPIYLRRHDDPAPLPRLRAPWGTGIPVGRKEHRPRPDHTSFYPE